MQVKLGVIQIYYLILFHAHIYLSSATDGKDGDVTSKVVVTGWASRDTSVIGKQVLTYTVTDSDFNVAFVVRYNLKALFTMN